MATINVDRAGFTVALTGPESSGKSTLAQRLGELFAVPVVPEVARDYFAEYPSRRLHYDQQDLLAISRRQLAAEDRLRRTSSGVLVCDTDLLVIQIWWQERYGELPDELSRSLAARSERVYLLTRPDLSWEADPLRENPEDRERLFELYRQALEASGFAYAVVSGSGEARLASALEGLSRLTAQ